MGNRAERFPREYVFYDLETTGLSPTMDQIVQVAMIRTDDKLRELGGDIGFDVRLRPDVVPNPRAFAVHKISPERLMRRGIQEIDAAHRMRQALLSESGALAVTLTGYNNINFDDAFLRNLMYRNGLPPYDHEWRSGNRRFDVLRAVRLTRALAPDALRWADPGEDGHPPLTLGAMCEANGVTLEGAHDAGEDTKATIGLARKLREGGKDCGKPWLWGYLQRLCEKEYVKTLTVDRKPIWVVDSLLVNRPNRCTLALPLTFDANNSNRLWCLDLAADLDWVAAMTPEELRDQMYRQASDRGIADERPGLLSFAVNQMAMVAPTHLREKGERVINTEMEERQGMAVSELAEKGAKAVRGASGDRLRKLVKAAMAADLPPPRDYAYGSLYTGSFIANEDEDVRAELAAKRKDEKGGDYRLMHRTKLTDVIERFTIADFPRQSELMLRAKWNSRLGDLLKDANGGSEWSTKAEAAIALTGILSRLSGVEVPEGQILPGDAFLPLSLDGFDAALAEVELDPAVDEEGRKVLRELDAYVGGTLKPLVELLRRQAKTLKAGSCPTTAESKFLSARGTICSDHAKQQQAWLLARTEREKGVGGGELSRD